MPTSAAPSATLNAPWSLSKGDTPTHFQSLSQMVRWSTSNLAPDDTVILARNGRTIFIGLWGGGLQDDPTLM